MSEVWWVRYFVVDHNGTLSAKQRLGEHKSCYGSNLVTRFLCTEHESQIMEILDEIKTLELKITHFSNFVYREILLFLAKSLIHTRYHIPYPRIHLLLF